MSEDATLTFQFSTGFLDYVRNLPTVQLVWQVIGIIFFTVNFLSYLPQPTELVTAKSSYGIEPLSFFCESASNFFLVMNILCLRSLDFVAFFQYSISRCLSRLVAFANIFFNWILFLPCVYQLMVFNDRELRPSRGTDSIRRDFFKQSMFAILLTLLFMILLVIWIVLAMQFGFQQGPSAKFGEVCGTVSTVLELLFFIPQLITTCRLRDAGSLSLLMLEIQGPSDLCNCLYMIFGTKDHWSSWLTILISSIEEFILLGTCIVFNCMKARRARMAEKEMRYQKTLNASIDPLPMWAENELIEMSDITN
ncbi:PQ loop repeat family protein [Tritrichomonas foetus]|uniref:PQ loop repeat family protein n=1 Tax=Tritrichomonas foetus TaxID=1144522 RepID=A0A1J4KWJ2_9EUKA|nr:PQ loop repeat family protein [Tritrichomonas foetus]|eukprot:OHT15611.1 PQ loop repeat family protein [Tritrichomonas foetus]